ncbi:MAG: DEAD/DEAH box helicase family protein [Lachnospiraceae bacterium]|nr:DEAD/DEAH box helicase family protein [Ruminococcus sp.]MCM1274283.1 DEAD/DEAH box helicase family protein [Lachnospiraceae bacterium]
MKLKFKCRDFQTEAVNAVADLFSGQEKARGVFSAAGGTRTPLVNGLGAENTLYIDEKTISDNMHAVQKRNGLPMTKNASDMQFCVEMETGTGKTYVYTKTIFELNRRYGFTKFIIVVPSVAIREGVYKSLETTREHFGEQYDNAPCRYFIYDSASLFDVRRFAASACIEIMIINIDAFKKSENIINQPQDKLNGETAMRYIRAVRPIVIIDEPQSTDNTPRSKEAVASLNPMCVLRYSATHREKINLLYRLTPVDAYRMGLVKQISVFSNQISGGFDRPYVRLLSVSNDKGFRARLEIDVAGGNGGFSRRTVAVKPGDELFRISGGRELYRGYSVAGIDCTPGHEHIEFGNTEEVALGGSIGGADEGVVERAQIRKTIETHLDKELGYTDMGIKVLSLFFIDRVDKYRREDGTRGIYAKLFEECYSELISMPKYDAIRERFSSDVSKIHDGYFSRDKRGRLKDTNGDTRADDDTYNTIMRDKEWLLSFECPLRFIFSHSALKEGWDNPNVFQVCTLIEQKSAFTCRQKVGRGLRLCVNREGERVEDKNINILHVMANESFAEFAGSLQKEIETEAGVKFGVLSSELFAGAVCEHTDAESGEITDEDARELMEHLEKKGYISGNGRIRDALKNALKNGTLELPRKYEAARRRIEEIIASADCKPPVRDASKDVTVRIKKQAINSPEFTELWNRIKQKTSYRVSVDTEALIENSVRALKDMPPIPKARLVFQTADIHIGSAGVSRVERETQAADIESPYRELPDIIAAVGDKTLLTPSTVYEILTRSGRLADFLNDPEAFTKRAAEIINDNRRSPAVEKIDYIKRDGREYCVREIFGTEEITANLDLNAVKVEHSVYDYVVCGSGAAERSFAAALDNDPDVKLFFKIPDSFKIDTPIGAYTPGWAVCMTKSSGEMLYFIFETTGSNAPRAGKRLKIHCGMQHFRALDNGIEMRTVRDWREFKATL